MKKIVLALSLFSAACVASSAAFAQATQSMPPPAMAPADARPSGPQAGPGPDAPKPAHAQGKSHKQKKQKKHKKNKDDSFKHYHKYYEHKDHHRNSDPHHGGY